MPCQLTQRETRTPIAAIFASVPRGVIGDPDADAALAPFAADVEAGEGADQPLLQPVHEAADVARRHGAMRAGQVQHDIGHALARAMIGPLAAATGGEGGEAGGVGQLLRPGGGAGGIERRMLDQPDQLMAAPARMAATRCCMMATASA